MSRLEVQWLPPGALSLPTVASARFVGPAEVVQLALGAFYAASRDLDPPDGEVWAYTGDDLPPGHVCYWSSPEDFAAGLLRHLGKRLELAALATGFAIERPCVDDDDIEEPEAMAQGCADLDLGAGAPPTTQPDASGSSHEQPLLCVQPGQELPQPGIAPMIDPAREVEA